LDTELSIIAYHLLLLLGQSVSARFPEPVERALAIMHENLHRSLSRKEICEYAMTSPAQLNRLFAAHLHKTPMGYFLDLKLSWAATMLDSTRMSVKEIAYRIGFENQFSFSSQFKNHYGMSPKEFRESRTEADKNAITQN
jgi:transcriptional regulator GlxA family with amidase domain